MALRRSILPLAMALFATARFLMAGELEPLIAGMADESFAVRQRATAELVREGGKDVEAVQALCLEHFLKNPEPEVRIRCKKVLRELLTESVGFHFLTNVLQAYFRQEASQKNPFALANGSRADSD